MVETVNEQVKTLDISTLDTSKRETTNSSKRFENRYTYNLHVKHKREELHKLVLPRGITMKIHQTSINEDSQSEGTLITLSGTDMNPSALCQRGKHEIEQFINTKLKVLQDSPQQLSQHKEPIKLETKIFSDEIAQKAFNICQKGKDTFGEI